MKKLTQWFICGLVILCCACSENNLVGEWTYQGPVPEIKDGPTKADKGCYDLLKKYDIHVYWQLSGDDALYTDIGQVSKSMFNAASLPMEAADEKAAEKFVTLLTKFFDILPEGLVKSGLYRRHVLVKIMPAPYTYTNSKGISYFCNTVGVTSMIAGAGSGVVYYGYLENADDTGDKFDTNLNGWKWSMAYEFFKGLIDYLDKKINVPDNFRMISKDYYYYEVMGTTDCSITGGTIFNEEIGYTQGFIHPYAAYSASSDNCDEDWGAMVASILTWPKEELNELYANYPLIKAKYDIIKEFFNQNYKLDIEALANQWRAVSIN